MAKILIIDDSLFQRKILSDIVKPDGHEILEADDGNKGLEMINSDKPDCILVDHNMPGITGHDLLKVLKEKNITIPTIMITANVQDSIKKESLELGVKAFISKPVDEQELKDAINNALEGK